jgi:glyoxylase-like metal-dependent hydrolase (beta-lactamase superfamily II)
MRAVTERHPIDAVMHTHGHGDHCFGNQLLPDDAERAADDIDLRDFADWGDPERIAVKVATAYRELDPSQPELSRPDLLVRMARWARRH